MKRIFIPIVLLLITAQSYGLVNINDLINELEHTPIIVKIDIVGHYPFMERRVRAPISISVGDPYKPDEVKEQAKRIEHFFEGEGYIGTEVSIQETYLAEKKQYFIKYIVRKGDRYRISDIRITGNTGLPRSYIVSQINPLLFYRPSRLREAIEDIRIKYQKKGYYNARVTLRPEDLDFDKAERQVKIWVKVKERDQVTVSFSGNKHLKSRTLKKALTFKKSGDYDSYEISKTKDSLLKLYRKKGYLKVNIASTREYTQAGKLKITYKIREGSRTSLYSIRFSGNEAISSGRLKKGMKVKQDGLFRKGKFESAQLKKDLDEIPKLYREKGYIQASVVKHSTEWSEDKTKVALEILIEEGKKTIVSETKLEGNRFFSERKLKRKLKLKKTKTFKPSLFQEDQDKISLQYIEKGFAYVKIKSTIQWDENNNGLIILHSIAEGPRVKIGRILVLGNSLTRKKSVFKALSMKEGDDYVGRKVLESSAILRRLGAFSTAKIETLGLEAQEPIVHLLVKVEENNRFVASVGSSFDTYERFSGELTLTNQNFFGYAKRGNLRIKGGERLQRGEINFIDPHFAGYNYELIATTFTQFEDDVAFNALQTGGALSILHQFRTDLLMLGRYQLTQTFITDEGSSVGSDPSKKDTTISEVGLSLTYDTRDYFADPKRGIYALGAVDLATTMFGTDSSFMKMRGWFGHYKTPAISSFFRRFTLVNNFRVEGVKNLKDTAIPIQELLFVGGDYTVRGFGQDQLGPKDSAGAPTGGQLSLVHNFELLFRLYGNFKAVGFLDSGTLTRDIGTMGLSSWRHSAGFGLRYITPLGPIRLDYGFKLDKKDTESKRRIHFTFGYPF